MNWRQAARTAALWIAGIIAGALLLFLLAAWVGSSLPRNREWTEPEDGIEILVETNGVHTAIVMPLVTPQKDWRGDFPASDIARSDLAYTHVSVSWGEREVFLNTPTWWDLTPGAAIGAITGGDGLLHVAYYVRPAPSETARPVTLRPSEYSRLVHAVEAQVVPPSERVVHSGYSWYDVFYDAPGRYHAGNTCNQWTSDTLAQAGVEVGRWTPFAGGVMKWFDPPAT